MVVEVRRETGERHGAIQLVSPVSLVLGRSRCGTG